MTYSPSNITWLDYSETDQRKVRELLQNFDVKGTLDDLGIGSIRDIISNELFPGTSSNLTRARYFLFIPWIFSEAEKQDRNQVIARSGNMERKLIGALKQSSDTKGLIGKDVGVNLQTLPSGIYWWSLAAFNILTNSALGIRQYARLAARSYNLENFEGEMGERDQSFWHREVPAAPDRFFKFEEASFSMNRDEADWLANRMSEARNQLGASSLLQAFADEARLGGPRPMADTPWGQAIPNSAPDEIKHLVGHAEHFSCLVEGAALLYNQMLGEERLKKRIESDPNTDPKTYSAKLSEWAFRAEAIGLADWASDLTDFWNALPISRRPETTAKEFVENLAEKVSHGDYNIADSNAVREEIQSREKSHKTYLSRFQNKTRLENWAGWSSTSLLTYRWPQVKQLILDLHDGFESGDPT